MENQYQTSLDILIQIRVNFRNLMNSIPEEDLFKIPAGFSNNIIWNFGHNLVSQQGLLYRMAGLEVDGDKEWFSKFGKGSVPDPTFVKGLREELILLSFSSLEKLQKDIFTPEIFDNYKTYKTSFGYDLHNLQQALGFNNIHESLHLGYAMAIRKALTK